MYYLYCITILINNKVYVGQSVDNKVRWRQHKYFSKNPGKSGQYIHRAMNKYGIENFKFDIVAISTTQDWG
jgi:group I intron endonuclease